MRVLFYNWADHRDPEQRGGGVSVYQRNIIKGLSKVDGVETAFLSSGLAHTLLRRKPHVITLERGESPRYALVNSGLVAPSHADFAGAAQLEHAETEAAFAEFVERTGPWDVIHFNNLEGLPANVLSLKKRWPGTRFVLSLHNYYPFCPQVNLWFAERETCTDFHGGASCTRCLPAQPEPRSIRAAYAMAWSLSRWRLGPGTGFYERFFRPVMGAAWRGLRRVLRARHMRRNAALETALVTEAEPAALSPASANVPPIAAAGTHHAPAEPRPQPPAAPAPLAAAFARRRARMVALINAHCDSVLAVSDRVRQIALTHGVHTSRLSTLYIGSAEAGEWHYSQPRPAFLRADGTIRLAYLGYMRRDKGYHFLMRALASLPETLAKRVHLTVAAKSGDAEAMTLLNALRGHLGAMHHKNGYTHDTLPTLLADVDLGVVPPVWEDNLPQVAIEMHARHIPLITSDRGGAQELGRCNDLVFRADDSDSFRHVLERILDGSTLPAQYWANAMAPVGLPEHIEALVKIYRETP